MIKALFILLIFAESNLAFANMVKWKDVTFNINVPENWREVKDFYGIPITLLGPSVSPKPRAVVQIIPTDLPPAKMNDSEAKTFGEKYAEGRKKWITEQEGELLELVPGKFAEGKLTAGVSYRINRKIYLERTYYVNCKKRIFHLKIVLNFENRGELPEGESIVRSFACAD